MMRSSVPQAGRQVLTQVSQADVAPWSTSISFADPLAAQRTLQRLARQPDFGACWPYLLPALDNAASPDRALVNFERFIGNSADPAALLR